MASIATQLEGMGYDVNRFKTKQNWAWWYRLATPATGEVGEEGWIAHSRPGWAMESVQGQSGHCMRPCLKIQSERKRW